MKHILYFVTIEGFFMILPGNLICFDLKYPERIKELRQDYDLTQKDVAKILKIAQTTYSQYELYKRPMPIECLVMLCKYYNVSADYMLGFTNEK